MVDRRGYKATFVEVCNQILSRNSKRIFVSVIKQTRKSKRKAENVCSRESNVLCRHTESTEMKDSHICRQFNNHCVDGHDDCLFDFLRQLRQQLMPHEANAQFRESHIIDMVVAGLLQVLDRV